MKQDILHFLRQLKESPSLPGIFIIAGSCDKQLSLFYSYVYRYIKATAELPIIVIDTSTTTLNAVKVQCAMSFLGTRQIYWLKDISLLETQVKHQWLDYIINYNGPHVLMFFDITDQTIPDKPGLSKIAINSVISQQWYQEFYALVYPEFTLDVFFVKKLFEGQEVLALEKACMLMPYQITAGKSAPIFFAQWFNRLLSPEKSLFNLSSALLSGQQKEFFQQWHIFQKDYPEEFWVAFWSEQIWQAALFVMRAQTWGIVEAKKNMQRLPFSFINKEWKRYSFKFLVTAHEALYALDYALKNGSSSLGLDLWFYKFFIQRF